MSIANNTVNLSEIMTTASDEMCIRDRAHT